MFTFVATLHVIVAITLIFFVLIQDSKGGATGGMFGGGGSNSILGATGATNLFVKITRVAAVVFAITCVTLTILVAKQTSSVLEGAEPPAARSNPATAAGIPSEPATPKTGDAPPAAAEAAKTPESK